MYDSGNRVVHFFALLNCISISLRIIDPRFAKNAGIIECAEFSVPVTFELNLEDYGSHYHCFIIQPSFYFRKLSLKFVRK